VWTLTVCMTSASLAVLVHWKNGVVPKCHTLALPTLLLPPSLACQTSRLSANRWWSDPPWALPLATTPVSEFLSDAPFFRLSLWMEFKLANCACASGWSQPLNLEANLETALFGVSNFERRFWSCLAHTWDSRGLYKASAITICIASLPWG